MTGAATDDVTGYVDVKVPAVARRRGLTPWKAWRRQWCRVRRCKDVGMRLDVHIGQGQNYKLQIALDCTVARTQSRSRQFAFGVFSSDSRAVLYLAGHSETDSQDWMRAIRHLLSPSLSLSLPVAHTLDNDCYMVSLIDNQFSQSAGLNGLYGRLHVTAQQVTIVAAGSGEVKAEWAWHHLQQFHLATNGRTEDEGKICVIHTSRDFTGGAGNIHLFCHEAPLLLQSLLSGGRLQRLLLSPLPTPPLTLLNTRRLSRSENDIRGKYDESKSTPKSSSLAVNLRRKRFNLRSSSSDKRSSTLSDEGCTNKIASSLISASLGLMFSTPGCSEVDSESVHEYQQVGFRRSEDDLVGDLIGMVKYRTPRRESGISVASGIYEEIPDVVFPPDVEDSLLYSNGFVKSTPPPLPPRRRHVFKTFDSGISSPITEWEIGSAPAPFVWPRETNMGTESDYMPMSPGKRSGKSIECDYMSMSPGKAIGKNLECEYMVMSSIDKL